MKRGVWIVPSLAVVALIIGFSLLSAINMGSESVEAEPFDEPEPTTERSRIRIPRPDARQSDGIPEAPSAGRSDPDALSGVDGTDDSDEQDDDEPYLPTLEGGSPELAEAMQAAMADAVSGMIECLAGWHDAQPDVFVGTAVFSIRVDNEGLEALEILDVESVPEATLACLGDVLWDDVPWPAADEPTEVTWPVQLSVREDGE